MDFGSREDVASKDFSVQSGSGGIAGRAFSLKQQRCVHCGCAESLNRHSKLYGNDPANPGGQAERGQRVFCSNRGQRGGCGRTFSIYLAEMLPRHTVRAGAVSGLLKELLAGQSIKRAAERLRLPFALETLYHLLARLRGRLDAVRSWLWRRQPAPASSHTQPLLQTVEHLQAVFPAATCPVSEFQVVFEEPLLG